MTNTNKYLVLFLLFLCLCIGSQNSFAQSSPTPFMIPDIENHDFHRKCGFDHAKEKKMAADPDYAKWIKQLKKDMAEMVANQQNYTGFVTPPIINIPIVVHVIHQGEAIGVGPNLSVAQIEAQIDVLNEDFSATNINFSQTPTQWQGVIGNPEINFCLAVLDPNGNASNGITRHNMPIIDQNNIETIIKPATYWNSNLYYNIWTLGIPGTGPGGGTTGYAYLPYNGTIGSAVDGTVVDYNWFGGPGFGQSGDGTLTHETGHYLGLFHTFDGSSCSSDDGLADTPNIDDGTSSYAPNLNCSTNNFPTGPTSCTNEHMYVNYMDYVNDDFCSTSFSNDQITVMRAVLDGTSGIFGSRLPLANNATAACTFYGDDAGVIDILVPGNLICNLGQVTPEVEIINFGQNTLTTTTISYEINNGTPIDFSWTGSLLTGESETVVLAPYSPPGGTYTFETYTQLPNGNADEQMSNDTMIQSSLSINPLSLPLYEDMEDPAWNPTVNGVFTFNISGDPFEWQRTTEASGYGAGTACAMFDNFEGSGGSNPGGTIDALITPIYDFTSVIDGQLTFDVAYTYFDNTFSDTLIILVSTNCGQNYNTQVYVKGGADLATAPPQGSPFTPNPTQWRTDTVDLSAYDGMDNVSVTFVNFSEWGNRMFIDNINLATPCGLNSTMSATDVSCFGSCDGIATVTPAGGSGSYTYEWDANAGGATTQTVTNLCPGTYSVTISDGPGCTAENSVTVGEPLEVTVSATATDETGANANDGTATANPVGGVMPFSYNWGAAGTTQTITGLTPATYFVTVTDGNGCTAETSVVVNPFDCSYFSISVVGTNVVCNGEMNGTATASSTSGVGTISYAWDNGDTTAMITMLAPNTYLVTATDGNGCTATGQYIVTEPLALSTTVTTTDETGLGLSDGTATANPTGGTTPYTYAWSNLGTTQTITGLAPNTYTVTVTDANGCTAIASGTVNAFVPDCSTFTLSMTGTNISCNGLDDGTATANPGGGLMPYTYVWSNLGTTQTITGLAPGTYGVVVTDANGCTLSDQYIVTEPIALSLSVITTDGTCFGFCDGMIDLTVSGGTSPYTFDWDNNALDGIEDPIDLCEGIYEVTVSDANGCTDVISATINKPTSLDYFTTVTEPDCNGGCNGSIDLAVSGGTPPYEFNWSNGEITEDLFGLCAGLYIVTVTDANDCTSQQTIQVGEPNQVSVVVSTTPLSGSGTNDGTATATPMGGTPGYTYNWSNGGTSQTITMLAPGTYTVTVTDLNGCTNSESVVINPFDCGNFEVDATSTNIVCNGACTGSINLLIIGGTAPFDFDWNDDTLDGLEDPTGLCAGNYEVTITDAASCSVVSSAVITEPFSLSVTLSSIPPSAPGANDASITANPMGGTPGYAYLWTPIGETTQTIFGLAPGTYSVVVTDTNGCTTEESIIINDIDCSNFTIELTTTDVICDGESNGQATVVATGGMMPYTYLWSNSETTQSITDLEEGTVSVIVTDANGCMLEASDVVGSPLPIELDFDIINLICNNDNSGSVSCNPSGGVPGGNYSFVWSDGSTSQTITGIAAGTYCVTVSDISGCSAESCVVVTEPPVLEASISIVNESTPGANDGSATCTPIGGTPGYTFLWCNGETSATATGLPGGVCILVLTDINGCSISEEVLIGTGTVDCSSFGMAISFSEPLCFGEETGTATASPSGGSQPYSFLWSTGETTGAITDLAAGSYFCLLTDANGCQLEQNFIITEPSALEASISVVDESAPGANDGSASCSPSGGTPGYTFQWCDGQTSATATGLPGGICTLVLTDANGCSITENVFIGTTTVDCTGFSGSVEVTNVSCFGNANGVATAFPQGGTSPYTYLWSNGATTQSITNLFAGSYLVTITDDNACEVIAQGNVTEPLALLTAPSSTSETTAGANDGTASANPSGGTAPYTYLWSNGGMTETIGSLMPGSYTVEVTDANGCVSESSVIVDSGNVDCTSLSTDVSTENVTCFGMENGYAAANVTGGTEPYGYLWNTGAVTVSVNDLVAGSYTVTVSDINGCEEMQSFVISQPTELIVSATSTDETTAGANDGTATATASNGTAPYTFLWSNGQTSAMISNLPPGAYTVSVTDANGCEQSMITLVGIGNVDCAGIDLEVTGEANTCFGSNDGIATAQVTGGLGPYTYAWDNGSNIATITGLVPGLYNVTISDVNGCQLEGSTVITQPLEITTVVQGNDGACGGNASASVVANGGSQPYTYLWSNGETGSFISGLTAGLYNVVVTDAMGCITSDQVQVQVNSEGIIVEQEVNAVTCFGESDGNIDLAILLGAAPYAFEWSNGAATEDLIGIPAGVYSVLITDAAGCSYFSSIEVGTPAELSVSIATSSASNSNNGTAEAIVFGGATPYSYNWSTGHQDVTIDGLGIGTYSVTVTDANGCTAMQTVNISVSALDDIESLISFNLFPNPSDGYFQLVAEFSNWEVVDVEVFSIVGQLVYARRVEGASIQVEVDIRMEPKGTYILRMRTEDGELVRKVLVY